MLNNLFGLMIKLLFIQVWMGFELKRNLWMCYSINEI